MNLKETYKKTVVPELQKTFGYKNALAVPTISHVVLNVGLGSGRGDAKVLETAENTLKRISGQQPVKTKARKSISNFKIRQGQTVGMKVTLRGNRMWDFLERMVKVTLPRVRDFRGLSPKLVDSQGNVSVGFKEHIAFPEIRSDEIEVLHGLQVTIAMKAKNSAEGLALLKGLGFPLKS